MNKKTKSSNPKEITFIDKIVGNVLKRLRKKAGLSQTEVASVVGVTFQQVQKDESGNNRIAFGKLCKYADALKINIQDLVALFLGDVHSDNIQHNNKSFAYNLADASRDTTSFFFDLKCDDEVKALIQQYNKISDKNKKKVAKDMIKNLTKLIETF